VKKDLSIAFIGAGNMAGSLIGGLIADGCNPSRLAVSDVDGEKSRLMHERYGIGSRPTNLAAAEAADVIVIAVKPQAVAGVARELSRVAGADKKLWLSIAAGIRTHSLETWLGGGAAVVRAMPNTPALVQSGATVLYANPRVTAAQRGAAESILRAVGLTLWIDDEALMDAVTALSGSGPAYFFLIMEALEQAGERLGLPPQMARVLAVQTAFGAGKMALESTDSGPAELRSRVTSPGGTTERAITVLEQGDLRALFQRALVAARDRSLELSRLLGESDG
jgi:pyrroline-5-carboxylate reductase